MRTITEAPCRGAGEHEFPTSRCREPDARRRRDVGWSRSTSHPASATCASEDPRIARSGCNGTRIWAYQFELAGRISTSISALNPPVAVALQRRPAARRRYALDAS